MYRPAGKFVIHCMRRQPDKKDPRTFLQDGTGFTVTEIGQKCKNILGIQLLSSHPSRPSISCHCALLTSPRATVRKSPCTKQEVGVKFLNDFICRVIDRLERKRKTGLRGGEFAVSFSVETLETIE